MKDQQTNEERIPAALTRPEHEQMQLLRRMVLLVVEPASPG